MSELWNINSLTFNWIYVRHFLSKYYFNACQNIYIENKRASLSYIVLSMKLYAANLSEICLWKDAEYTGLHPGNPILFLIFYYILLLMNTIIRLNIFLRMPSSRLYVFSSLSLIFAYFIYDYEIFNDWRLRLKYIGHEYTIDYNIFSDCPQINCKHWIYMLGFNDEKSTYWILCRYSRSYSLIILSITILNLLNN